jgi:hypothetical protein
MKKIVFIGCRTHMKAIRDKIYKNLGSKYYYKVVCLSGHWLLHGGVTTAGICRFWAACRVC